MSEPGEQPVFVVRREMTEHADQDGFDEFGKPIITFEGGLGPQITHQFAVRSCNVVDGLKALNAGCAEGVDFVALS